MPNPDVSREAAHKRYAKAAQIAAEAGATTQAGLNEAYRNLLENTDWTPSQEWAQGYQSGVQAHIPNSIQQLIDQAAEQKRQEEAQRQQIRQQIQPSLQLSGAPRWAKSDSEGEQKAKAQAKTGDESGEKPRPVELRASPEADSAEPMLDSNVASGQKSVVVDESGVAPFEQVLRDSGVETRRDRDLRPSVQMAGNLGRMVEEPHAGTPEQLAALERAFADWQNDWEQRTAVKGYDPILYALSALGMGDVQKAYNEEVQRRFTDMNTGELRKDNPLGWNFLGFTSQQQTPRAARAIYDWHFANEDASAPTASMGQPVVRDTVVPEWLDNGPSRTGLALRDDDLITLLRQPQARQAVLDWYNEPVVNPNAIDDGSSPDSRESLMMTGEQYLKYREQFGIPGRDIKDISPNELYNKQREQDRYGFIPYITSQESLDRFHDAAAPMLVSDAFQDLANLRRNNTDFTINYNGEQFSGKDFAKNARLWDQRNSGKEGQLVFNQEEADEYSIPQALTAIDENGNEYVAPNAPIAIEPQDDGTIVVRFNDNPDDDWVFDNQEDYNTNVKTRPANDGEWISGWLNQEPLVLDSGQVLRADQAKDLLQNQDQYSDYGPFDFNKPGVVDPFKEGGWAPWIVDMALSSAPYFWLPASAAKATGDSMNNAQGFAAGSPDYLNGTYSLLSDSPTRDQQVTSTLGSALMPLTERIWGPLGEQAFFGSPARRLASIALPDSVLERPSARLITGAVNEGFEEIPGGAIEELQSNGLDWYANNMYRDENGNLTDQATRIGANGEAVENPIAVDSQGREIRTSTDLPGRLVNYAEDWPLAFTGGALLGGGLGTLSYPGYVREYRDAKRERNQLGYNGSQAVDMDALMRTSGLDDFQRRYYNAPSSR